MGMKDKEYASCNARRSRFNANNELQAYDIFVSAFCLASCIYACIVAAATPQRQGIQKEGEM